MKNRQVITQKLVAAGIQVQEGRISRKDLDRACEILADFKLGTDTDPEDLEEALEDVSWTEAQLKKALEEHLAVSLEIFNEILENEAMTATLPKARFDKLEADVERLQGCYNNFRAEEIALKKWRTQIEDKLLH